MAGELRSALHSPRPITALAPVRSMRRATHATEARAKGRWDMRPSKALLRVPRRAKADRAGPRSPSENPRRSSELDFRVAAQGPPGRDYSACGGAVLVFGKI